MSRAKTERLLNLVLCLLDTGRYLTKEHIRQAVPGYPESAEAFARAFERDKDELREMGIPLRTGVNSALFDDDIGYRIPRDDYALPQINLTTHEWALVELASRAWQSSTLGADAQRGLLKLKAQHNDQQPNTEEANQTRWWQQPDVNATTEANPQVLASLAQAVSARQQVSFGYRKPHEQAQQRVVQPWGLVAQRGRWYLVGQDVDRGQQRVFRLSRLQAPVHTQGPEHSYEIPAGLDLSASVAMAAPASKRKQATLALAPGAGSYFRRYARWVNVGGCAPAPAFNQLDHPEQRWDEVGLDYVEAPALAGQVAALAGQGYVVAPLEVAQLVREHLDRVLAATPVAKQVSV